MSNSTKEQLRYRRHQRIRAKVSGTSSRPRLVVFRSLQHISAQLVDDTSGHTLASASSLKLKKSKTTTSAKEVGLTLAKIAQAAKIETCVFDRNGYLYHGRVKQFAEGAREGGLKF